MIVGLTGGSGFVGRHAIEVLRARGYHVELCGRGPAVDRVVDLAVRPLVPGTFDGLDVVVHAAAYLPTSYADAAEAQRCMDLNALGTLAVLDESARAGVKQIVHLSTNLYRFSKTPVTEDAPFEPSTQASYYLVSKAAADFFAGHASTRLGVAILRLGSVYGPHLARGIVAGFTTQLLAGTPISVDDGAYQADFVDVGDVATAIAEAVERRAVGAFNIGSGVATRPVDVAEQLLAATGADRSLLRLTAAANREPRGFSALDVTRARQALGYEPRPLAEGLAAYVRWRREAA